ncbi:MAG TPA: NAD(P)/FAD-dependent oxidoreductase [Actinomycetota bacterium]|nr:NAD(P)/FAD-dependent oxidoreductase [Actinomycetota bacterium]
MAARRYDAIIIGGGHNGLVCAAYLARAGASVIVLERRHLLGGAAVTEEPWPGFRVSTASYVVSLMVPRIIRDLGLARHGYEVYPLDPSYFTPFPDGRGLLVWEDRQKAADEVARFSKRDAEAYLRYDEDLEALSRFVRPLLLRIPPSLVNLSFGTLLEYFSLSRHARRHRRVLPRLLDLMTMSVADFLDDYFENEAVKGALAPGGVIGMWGGPMSPGSAYVLLHHRMGEAAGGRGAWGFVRGGMGALSESIASAARAAGAEIRTEADVVAVETTDGRARGVALADGSQLLGRAVVSGIHPRTTFLDLVGREHLPEETVRDVERYRTRGGSAKVNMALDGLPDFTAMPGTELGPQHPEFIINPSIGYLERAWDDAKYGEASAQPMLDCVIPTTKDHTLAPERKHVLTAFVQYAPYQLAPGHSWDKERDVLGDRVVETIAAYAPNIKDVLIHREVVTPLDLERRFGLVGGNIFQGEMALDQLFFARPIPQAGSYRTPVRGLYLCGSGTHPGGGVLGASGHNAARVVRRDLRRRR